jgi:glycosyltransferase involved in cell wall biosynthesis
LSQTFSDFELIVIDDGSTDATLTALESYGDRIKPMRQAHEGPEAARRKAAKVAVGEYFVLLDSDDLLLPWALTTYDRVIRECDEPGLIIGSLTHFLDGEYPRPEAPHSGQVEILKFKDYLAKDMPVGLSSSNIVVRRSVFEQSGALRSTFSTFPMVTFHYVLMFGTFGPCTIIQRPNTVAYRLHKGNAIRNTEGMLKGILSLVDAERQGLYPGGRVRWFDRYVCIGGITVCWIMKALKQRSLRSAFTTAVKTSPMVLTGALEKFARQFRPRTPLVHLAKNGHSLILAWLAELLDTESLSWLLESL